MLLLRVVLIWTTFILTFPSSVLANPELEMAQRCLKDENKREMSGKLLALITSLPTPPIVPVEEEGGLLYLTSSVVFSRILGTSPNAMVLNDSEELRFLPYTLSRTPILLVLRSSGDWSIQKARKVMNVAKLQGHEISLVWLHESAIPTSFRVLAKETGGRVFGLRDINRLVMRHVCSR